VPRREPWMVAVGTGVVEGDVPRREPGLVRSEEWPLW